MSFLNKIFWLATALVIIHGGAVQGAEKPSAVLASDGHVLGFNPEGLVIATREHAVTVAFAAAQQVTPVVRKTSSTENPEKTDRIVYSSLWRDIDLVYEKTPQGLIKSTYLVDPGGDPSAIRLRYNRSIRIDERGELVVRYENGEWREAPPVAWEEGNGFIRPVAVSYRQWNDREIGFTVSGWKGDTRLVIDPVATWNTFLGSSRKDYANGIAVDGNGFVYITGTSHYAWGGYQTTDPFLDIYDSSDAFVAKLDGTLGILIWNTFLGSGESYESSAMDYGNGIALDGNGNIYITGTSYRTWGENPVRGFSGVQDAFVAKFSAETGELLKHTFLGATNLQDTGQGITAKNGKIYVVGQSEGSWINAPEPKRSYAGEKDAFVARLDGTTLNLEWYTFLGSYSHEDRGGGLAVHSSGDIFVVGSSKGSWGGTKVIKPHSPWVTFDIFVARLNDVGELQWNTFLGSGSNYYGTGIAVDSNWNIYITGHGSGVWAEQPLQGYHGAEDAFAAHLDGSGALRWHTFIGSDQFDYALGITIDQNNQLLVTGHSDASWGSPLRLFTPGGFEAFSAKLKNTGELIWNSFLGGSGTDYSKALAVDIYNNVYVVGDSDATWNLVEQIDPVSPFADSDAYEPDISIAKLTYRTISGTVRLAGGSPLGGVTVSLSTGGSVQTDSNGYYQFIVNDGWSGSVFPVPNPYRFEPTDKPYDTLSTDVIQDFYTAENVLTISGKIWEGGIPVPGVTVTAEGGGSTVTNEEGEYQLTVSYNWAGEVSPSLAGYEIVVPATSNVSRSYTGVTSNLTGQDYSATWLVYVSGNVTVQGGGGLENVVLNGLPGDPTPKTDGTGNYHVRIRNGWSGKVTPTLAGFLFNPESIVYTNVTEVVPANYTAIPAWELSGVIRDQNGKLLPEVEVTVTGLSQKAVTNSDGIFKVSVAKTWTGTLIPKHPYYNFTAINPADPCTPPPSADEYEFCNALGDDRTDLDFTASWATHVGGKITLLQSDGIGKGGVQLNGLPGDPVPTTISDDSNPENIGTYNVKINYDWSGTVTPALPGYLFEPESLTLYNVRTDSLDNNFIAFPVSIISISVKESDGTPVSGAVLTVNTNDKPPFAVTTDASGSCIVIVKKGLPLVTITPIKSGYIFSSVSYAISPVDQDNLTLDIAANWTVYLSGVITKSGGGGLAGVLLKGLPGNPRTDQSGSYRARVGYEWSGTVAPTLLGYRFEPEPQTLSLVTTEVYRDFTAYTVPTHSISGKVRASGAPLAGVVLNASSGETTSSDGDGNFRLDFNEGWSGNLTPTAGGHIFYPPVRNYSFLVSDLISQDFNSGSAIYLPLILKR